MKLAPRVRLFASAALFALALLAYALFATDENTFLVLLGLVFLASAVYIGSSVSKTLKTFRPFLPIAVFVVLGEWFFFSDNLTNMVLYSPYGVVLTTSTTWVTTHVLNAIGIGAVQDGNLIVLTSPASKLSAVNLENACSGAEGSLLFVAAAGLMTLDLGRRVPRRMLLISFSLGAIGVYSLTLLRVPATILIGYFYGPSVMETFHLYAGELMFLGAIAVYWWASMRWFARSSASSVAQLQSRS